MTQFLIFSWISLGWGRIGKLSICLLHVVRFRLCALLILQTLCCDFKISLIWILLSDKKKPLKKSVVGQHLFTALRVFQNVRMDWGPSLPDSLVLEIFLHLPHDAVLRAGLTCRQWQAVSRDEFLWRELFYSYYRIPRSVPRHPCMYW